MDIGSLTGAIRIEDQATSVLSSVSAKIIQFAKNFDSAVGAVVVGAAAMAGAITGIIASIIALGQKGSTILGVEEAFNRLSVSVGSTGEAMIGALSEGVRGTVDSMELMQSTTRLLSSGLKITEEDMRLMGATAREMGKATGTDAASGLNILSQAMLTGNARSLRRFGIQLDLVSAEKQLREATNNTADALSAAGRLEVNRIAVLEGMRQKLDKLGESQLSFKERVQQATVSIGNWFDSLAKGVASSAAVNRAFDTVARSFSETFGGTAQTVLQMLLSWVDKFADGVTRIGPIVIRVIADIRDRIVSIWNEVVAFNERWQITNNLIAGARVAWGVLETAFNLVKFAVQAVIRAWSEMPEWLQRITRTALEGSVALAAYSVAIQGVATPFKALIGTVDLTINILGNLTGAILSSVLLWPKLVVQYNLATAALGRFIVAQRMSVVGHTIEKFALESVALAKQTLAVATIYLEGAVATMTARIVMSTAYLRAHAAMVWIVNTAKAAWALAVAAVSTAYTGLITRLGLATVATRVSTIATYALATAMEAFGFVILGIQAIPLVAALGGLVLGLNEVRKAWQNLQKAHEEGKTTWEFLTAKDSDTWARRWLNYATQFVAGVDIVVTKIETARKRIKGGASPGSSLPISDPEALAAGSAEFQAAAAARRGIGLTEGALFDAGKSAKEYAERLKEIRDMYYGEGVIKGALDTVKALGPLPNITKMSAENQKRLNEQMGEAILTYGRLGRVAPQSMRDLFTATRSATDSLDKFSDHLIPFVDASIVAVPTFASFPKVINGIGDSIEDLGEKVDIVVPKFAKFTVMEQIGQGISDIFKGLPDAFAQAFTGGGGLAHAFKAIGSQLAKAIVDPIIQKFKEVREAAGIIMTQSKTLAASIGTAIAGLTGGAIGGAGGAAVAGIASSVGAAAAASGALGAGIAASSLAIGAVTAGIGIAAAAVFALAKRWFGVSKEVQETRKAVADFADQLSGTLTPQQKLEAGGVKWKETIIAVRDAYLLIGRTAEEAQSVVSRLWDTGNPARARAASQEIAINMALAQNIRSVRLLVQEYVGAGTVIPEALQRNIDQLVKMGKLTAENAAQMLNLTKTAVPSYADVTAAAERYGIQVEALGAGVQKLRITEIAEQAVIDWKLFEDAGADMNVVIAGMTTKLQDVVTTALKLGIELPKSVKPIIERMIEAGSLTDEFGEKLVDTSRLTWAETLTDKIEKLVDAMLKLVDVIDRGVGGALDNISNKVISPKIAPRYEGTEVEEPAYLAGGGRVLAFRARGTDTVPAMLTPGERVLSRSEAAGYGREQGNETVIFEVDGREFTRAVVMPNMRDNVKRYRLSRR